MDALFGIALILHWFENPYAFGALVACAALLLSMLKRSYGLSFFVTVALTFALTHSIKSLYKIARPDDALVIANGYRFPSMHASIAAAILTSLAWHWYFKTTQRLLRIGIVAGTSALIVFIGWTRILLQVHEVIDVLAGVALGVSISLIFHYLMRRYKLE